MNVGNVDNSIVGFLKMIFYGVVCVYNFVDIDTEVNAYTLFALLGFMILDMILGIVKAKCVPELKNPNSKDAKKGILAKSIMLVIPIVMGGVWGIFDEVNKYKVMNVFLGALAVAEAYSCIGNAGAIYTKEKITEYDAITFVFKTASKSLKKMISVMLKSVDDDIKSDNS